VLVDEISATLPPVKARKFSMKMMGLCRDSPSYAIEVLSILRDDFPTERASENDYLEELERSDTDSLGIGQIIPITVSLSRSCSRLTPWARMIPIADSRRGDDHSSTSLRVLTTCLRVLLRSMVSAFSSASGVPPMNL
jgi:hypothetical protein